MKYVIDMFILLLLGESFKKIKTKTATLQIHEDLRCNVNEIRFSNFYANFHEVLVYRVYECKTFLYPPDLAYVLDILGSSFLGSFLFF